MDAIIVKMRNPVSGFITFLAGTTITFSDILTQGPTYMAWIGGFLALLGGWWTFRTSRVKYSEELLRLRIAEIEFERVNSRQPFSNSHRRRR
jgi:hypothetical protein